MIQLGLEEGATPHVSRASSEVLEQQKLLGLSPHMVLPIRRRAQAPYVPSSGKQKLPALLRSDTSILPLHSRGQSKSPGQLNSMGREMHTVAM